MKIVFLDIDGVLIHHGSIPKHTPRKADPECVARLNKITDATGAKIVISSTWRTMDDIEKTLDRWGITAEIWGKTPSGYDPGRISLGVTRGNEINTWLVESKFKIDSFVILDDDNDMEPLSGHLVQTSFKSGLTDEHVELAIRKLRGPL